MAALLPITIGRSWRTSGKRILLTASEKDLFASRHLCALPVSQRIQRQPARTKTEKIPGCRQQSGCARNLFYTHERGEAQGMTKLVYGSGIKIEFVGINTIARIEVVGKRRIEANGGWRPKLGLFLRGIGYRIDDA